MTSNHLKPNIAATFQEGILIVGHILRFYSKFFHVPNVEFPPDFSASLERHWCNRNILFFVPGRSGAAPAVHPPGAFSSWILPVAYPTPWYPILSYRSILLFRFCSFVLFLVCSFLLLFFLPFLIFLIICSPISSIFWTYLSILSYAFLSYKYLIVSYPSVCLSV